MQIKAAIKGDLEKIVQQKNKNILKAVGRAVNRTGNELQREMAGQTQRAGLGHGLSKSWKTKTYNKNAKDKFAKKLVYTDSPKVMEGFETGGVRKPTKGKWIAIPTENVPKSRRKRYTPENWPKSYPELYFAQDTNGKAYLVGQTVHKTNKHGKTRISKTSRKTESQAETVIYFFLVKQTKHVKRLSFEHASKHHQKKMKLYISQELDKTEQ